MNSFEVVCVCVLSNWQPTINLFHYYYSTREYIGTWGLKHSCAFQKFDIEPILLHTLPTNMKRCSRQIYCGFFFFADLLTSFE